MARPIQIPLEPTDEARSGDASAPRPRNGLAGLTLRLFAPAQPPRPDEPWAVFSWPCFASVSRNGGEYVKTVVLAPTATPVSGEPRKSPPLLPSWSLAPAIAPRHEHDPEFSSNLARTFYLRRHMAHPITKMICGEIRVSENKVKLIKTQQ